MSEDDTSAHQVGRGPKPRRRRVRPVPQPKAYVVRAGSPHGEDRDSPVRRYGEAWELRFGQRLAGAENDRVAHAVEIGADIVPINSVVECFRIRVLKSGAPHIEK